MPDKIKESEHKQLQKRAREFNEQLKALGEKSYEIQITESHLEQLRKDKEAVLQQLEEKETAYQDFMKTLFERYGDQAINVEDGRILDPSEVPS